MRQELEAAIQHYIGTRDNITQERILSRWVTRIDVNGGTDQCSDPRKRRRTEEPQDPDETRDQGREDRPDEAPNQEQNEAAEREPEKGQGATPKQSLIDETDEASDEEFGKLRQKAVAFFIERRRKASEQGEPLKRPLNWKVAQKALVALQEGYEYIRDKGIGNLWDLKEPVGIHQPPEDNSPLQRVTIFHESISSSVHLNDVKRRFTALLIYHECKENLIQVTKRKGKQEREEERRWGGESAKRTGLSFKSARGVHNNAYAWTNFIRAWGLGGLVMPGPSHRDVLVCLLNHKKRLD